MIVPMNLFDLLLAVSAGSAAKPLLHNTTHLAIFRIVFNWVKARLATGLTLRPARTPVELETPWSDLHVVQRSFSGIQANRRLAPRFRTCDETFPTMTQIGAKHDGERDDRPDDQSHTDKNQ